MCSPSELQRVSVAAATASKPQVTLNLSRRRNEVEAKAPGEESESAVARENLQNELQVRGESSRFDEGDGKIVTLTAFFRLSHCEWQR
jgi:hypothetical protein